MKRTAANTALLTVIKRTYSGKIYKHAMSLYNTADKAAVVEYLQQFHLNDIVAELTTAETEEIQRRTEERSRCYLHLIR